ncbi:MAG: hypothetical protein KBA51_07060 [Kiritimatiellae bacterium]|nr:hypothetical protein [Kiritimatiellia bacterium]
MSIIQDALRRKEEESGGAHVTPPPAPPGTPSSHRESARAPAPRPPPPRQEHAYRGPLWAVGSFVLILLMVAVAAWVYRESRPHPPRAERGDLPPPVALAAPAESLAHEGPTERTDILPVVEAVPEEAVLPQIVVFDPALESAEVEPSTTPAIAAEVPAGGLPATDPAAVPSSGWPSFTVRGVVAPSGSRQGTVFLGDDMIDVGRSTRQGIRVISVQGEETTLEYRGERRSYRVGEGED